jgi:hypothetical protein
MLNSLPTTTIGTVGMRRCRSRNTLATTVPLPVPASNTRSAGGVGCSRSSSLPIRSATTAFSLVVVTNSRYFSRLSKKRNGSPLGPCGASPLVSASAAVSVVGISTLTVLRL